MGVSVVTISIEEFEDLIRCKRKIVKLKELKESNIKEMRATNILAKKSLIDGDIEALGKVVTEQDNKNLIYIAKIVEVLESEE